MKFHLRNTLVKSQNVSRLSIIMLFEKQFKLRLSSVSLPNLEKFSPCSQFEWVMSKQFIQ
ncbi:hypothetical protein T11_8626 [Trichinella zimbabwensis]|uniref:Uncharacterized protein n=1 Tax=Trichinella zimbabwensis TaxID=268475 RepID=A0A0V1HQM9_9BILA|nr:hypothetical protein T11_8626 [Trichinella zimbabwensis]